MRFETGLSQADMARRLGLSPAQLCNAEQGRYGLSLKAAERLQRFLKDPPPTTQPSLAEGWLH